ncbi:hypothetical protein ACZ87_01782 [Candidatus Erwinia dacicola]|uniref:Uncharacterized protein n=1 Tax=Candidatus Erwinia dacicola TaxID=252393 RepID=A0A328TQQ8_9GAMM|nr:hypothetical protein ACZ87_01782 [Candidatus Erwinia dacicola]
MQPISRKSGTKRMITLQPVLLFCAQCRKHGITSSTALQKSVTLCAMFG